MDIKNEHKEITIWSKKNSIFPIIPFMCLVPPCFLLIDSVVPFSLISFFIYSILNIDNILLNDGRFIFYIVIIAISILNFSNAVFLSFKHKMYALLDALLLIRGISMFIYASLIWGLIFSIFIMALGGIKGQYLFYLILSCIMLLNLSGAFYAIPIILKMKKEKRLTFINTFLYIFFEFIFGADILITFLLAKKTRRTKFMKICGLITITPIAFFLISIVFKIIKSMLFSFI